MLSFFNFLIESPDNRPGQYINRRDNPLAVHITPKQASPEEFYLRHVQGNEGPQETYDRFLSEIHAGHHPMNFDRDDPESPQKRALMNQVGQMYPGKNTKGYGTKFPSRYIPSHKEAAAYLFLSGNATHNWGDAVSNPDRLTPSPGVGGSTKVKLTIAALRRDLAKENGGTGKPYLQFGAHSDYERDYG